MYDVSQERVVRVVLPVNLIRQLDQALLQRLGGFETRAEFIREAVANMLLELNYEPAQPEFHFEEPDAKGTSTRVSDTYAGRFVVPADGDARPTPAWDEVQAPGTHRLAPPYFKELAATTLEAPERGAMFEEGIATVPHEPLFGLHNRDFPSLWAAHVLADLTREDAISWSDYLAETIRRAWSYAEALRPLEQSTGRKLTVMFPRNRSKLQAAEEGFLTFAVGGVAAKSSDDRLRTWGPLFSWQACQLQRRDGELYVALTDHGYRLLEALDGISLDMPHPPEAAESFFAHLQRFAPADWWGFGTVLAAEEPDREELQEHFRGVRSDWSEAVVGTNTQGYVGRAREWGLLEPKLVRGRYLLTDFGREVLKKANDL